MTHKHLRDRLRCAVHLARAHSRLIWQSTDGSWFYHMNQRDAFMDIARKAKRVLSHEHL